MNQNTKVPDFTFAAKRSEKQAAPISDELTEEPYNDQTETESDDQELGAEMEMEADETAPASNQTASKGKKLFKKKSMSIAEFLARKTENELQAKLKVCIVQHGETLDSLSERYQLSISSNPAGQSFRGKSGCIRRSGPLYSGASK